jgi:hypothetical protein
MSKYLVGVLVGFIVLSGCMGYLFYKETKRNGELSVQLDTAKDAAAKWKDLAELQQHDLAAISSRAAVAVAEAKADQTKVQTNERLFRNEIDNLKKQNKQLQKILDTRIDDGILRWLCKGNYATTDVCSSVLPTSGNVPSGLPGNTTARPDLSARDSVGAERDGPVKRVQRTAYASAH